MNDCPGIYRIEENRITEVGKRHIDWHKTPAVVLGGAGLIGSHVVDELVDRGANVLVVDHLEGLCKGLSIRRAPPPVVAGPTTGGIVLAFETARQLGVRGIFAEEVRDPDGATRREFRRGFAIEPGERVLLVDDILTTGGSLLAMVPAVEAAGGEIVACFVMADRSGGTAV